MNYAPLSVILLFADDVKMVFLRSQSSHLLSSFSSAWAWAGKWDLPINPNKCSCLTVGSLPPLSPYFCAADTDRRIPQVTHVRHLGVPSARPSTRQPTAERLRIQQGVCCSWSEGPSVNYPKQRLPRSTVPKCGLSMQWRPTPQH